MMELTILDIIKIILRRIWLIIAATILSAAIGFVYCKMFATPQYMATASLYGSNNSTVTNTITQTDIVSSQLVVNTYVALLRSNHTLDMVIEDTNLNYIREELQDMIEFTISNNTSVVLIKVTCEDSEHAIKIANSLANLAPDIVNSFFTNDNTVSSGANNFMKVIDTADDTEQVAPRTLLITFICGFAGCAGVVFIVLLLEVMDKTIKTEQDIVGNYNIPVLGTVPDFDATHKGARYYYG